MRLTTPIPVELSSEEAQKSYDFCVKLQEDKKNNNVVDLWYDKKNSSFGVNVLGHLGEVAVSRVLGTPVDYEIRTHGDAGYDTTYAGKTVQVKTSTLPTLIFNSARAFSADIAILVEYVGNDRANANLDPRFVVHGWITREEFMVHHHNHDYGYGVRLTMDSYTLYPLQDLVDQTVL